MKVGFAKKSKQKKNKQKKNKKGAADDDAMMADVQQPGSPVELAPADEQLSARDKQRKRMELKKALRVKVSSLKQDRNKLTKLAGNKTERRKLSKQIQGLLQEEIMGKGRSKKKKPAAAAASSAAAAALPETMED